MYNYTLVFVITKAYWDWISVIWYIMHIIQTKVPRLHSHDTSTSKWDSLCLIHRINVARNVLNHMTMEWQHVLTDHKFFFFWLLSDLKSDSSTTDAKLEENDYYTCCNVSYIYTSILYKYLFTEMVIMQIYIALLTYYFSF